MTKKFDYKSVDGLTIVDSITWKDISGGFYLTNGYSGYKFRLDSNLTFKKIDFSCMAKFTVDSGSWAIANRNIVVLKSTKQTIQFDVLKFDDFLFFIAPVQRHKFIKDLKAAKVRFRKARAVIVDNKTYTVNFLIGYSLVENYYAKQIEDIPGT